MGENLELEGRLAVRSTMQWSDRPDGGFGPSDGDRSERPPPTGPYGPERVNVASQRTDPDSLLNWLAGAVRARRQIPEPGEGRWAVLDTDDPAVLAHCCSIEDSMFVAVHNPAGHDRSIRMRVEAADSLGVALASPEVDVAHEDDDLLIGLPPYGHVWLQTQNPLQGHTTGLPLT